MAWEKIIGELDKVKHIVGEWQTTGEITGIEKELALDKIRLIYEAVKFAETQGRAVTQEVPAKSPAQQEVPMTPKASAARQEESSAAIAAQVHESSETTDIYGVPVKPRHDRKKLMSLYDDGGRPVVENAPTAEEHAHITENKTAPADIAAGVSDTFVPNHAEPDTDGKQGVDVLAAMGLAGEPAKPASRDTSHINTGHAEVSSAKPHIAFSPSQTDADQGHLFQSKVFGETIKTGETVADIYAKNNKREDMAEHIKKNGNVASIRGAIGINDRFLLIRDLFAGNADACDRTISQLDGFKDLDDALLYIHDNYSWNPDSDGAKLLVDLLTRKLS